jgi:hypothetical protein
MPFKNSFQSTLVSIVTVTLLFAFTQGYTNKNEAYKDKFIKNEPEMSIDTFSTFPPEIDGCSCYFSNDSSEFNKGKYIYINDYAQTSFLKINGVLTRFTQTYIKEIDSLSTIANYIGDIYNMTIELKDGIQNGDETWLKSGTINVTDISGNTITKTFYGECGC